MPFFRELTQSEMQTASSRILNSIGDSIFYDNNCYVKHISYAHSHTWVFKNICDLKVF